MTPTDPNQIRNPDVEYSLGGMMMFILAPFALIALASDPVFIGGLIGGTVLLAVLFQKLLRTYVDRVKDRTHTLAIPGVGEVTYRVSPR
jgi:hypothetical protein